jgi:hypothetical protein
MQVGSLVKTNGRASWDYPKGVGIVVAYRDEGLHKMYNTAYVQWPNDGVERSIRHQFLDIVCE